ncbi:hypothetical protein B5S33_g32 [[Candida] boidinii]|nr:hypothetical protein B5S33_g32 [[Candida] boidinii]
MKASSTSTSSTNSNGPLTYSTVATSILEEMIIPMIHEIVAVSMLNEQTIRDRYGKSDNPIYIDTRNPIGNDEDALNGNGEGTNIGNNGGNGINGSNNNNSGDRVKRLKNGNGGSSSNGNGNGYNDGGSSTPSAVNSAHNSPQPGAPDIGRFQFVANGRDIYSNARQQRYMNGNANGNGSNSGSGNGNGSGQSTGQSNGQADGGVESRYMGVSDSVSGMANGNALSAVSMTSSNNASEIYFSCSNCNRKIAGSRFASHIDRCLGGRTRK